MSLQTGKCDACLRFVEPQVAIKEGLYLYHRSCYVGRYRLPRGLYPGDKVYVAARFERQAEARDLAQELVDHGYRVTSRWLFVDGLKMGTDQAATWAQKDLEDLDAADAVVALSDEVPGRGGKDFELGYAYARGKRCVVVGPPMHVFHHLPHVVRVTDLMMFRVLYLGGEKIDEVVT